MTVLSFDIQNLDSSNLFVKESNDTCPNSVIWIKVHHNKAKGKITIVKAQVIKISSFRTSAPFSGTLAT